MLFLLIKWATNFVNIPKSFLVVCHIYGPYFDCAFYTFNVTPILLLYYCYGTIF